MSFGRFFSDKFSKIKNELSGSVDKFNEGKGIFEFLSISPHQSQFINEFPFFNED